MNAEADEPQAEESLISHLIELRSRLIRSIVAVLVLFVALFPFREWLYTELAEPLTRHLPHGGHLIATEVSSPFFTPIKLTAVLALVLAMPVVIYQAWAFVSPGLYRHEKRLARPLLVSAVLLFYTGCAFAYFLVMPAAFRFLTAVTPQGVEMMTDINHYLSFVLTLFFAFGLCFEVPVAVVILVAIGLLSVDKLRKSRPYVVVVCFALAAVLTPPDVMSQVLLAVPMYLLFEAGILASTLLVRTDGDTADADD
ncbi:twin-arginine translocase subunit TatC [Oleiagrimonas soli]|uniref:Sec-independent protein translocase protein TatC n=1 Tax=Oleiagrimonas soli TaxID=1543381 RepID=A0A099CYZ0_9GAMM|nr:twin-arginine translocase subunit TatC [Oleiagrimonas soli]KGI78954.1 twin-arginine protein translocation system subunit TatC [Oleiagrimonas soli]MBB6184534.1 sec-independent protein translocase protein TatC [Oleiagrimonas soli]